MSNNKRRSFKGKKEQSEFDQTIVEIARVTRVMAGGKRMRFRAAVLVGDRKGRIGFGLAKGKDVSDSVGKASKKAEKNLIKVNLTKGTIPHGVLQKYGAAKVMLKPAPVGTGIISGGSVRLVLELLGVENIVSKIMGGKNKINNVKATIEGLKKLKAVKSEKKDLNQENNK
ncbi:MAG: 30S ribosomal protein S5 [Patescibacteria group bacterium]